MEYDLLKLIKDLAGRRVLVIGEAMLDSYLEGSTSRLCREAPVPVVTVASRQDVPGGAANTAVNVCSLGGQATLLSVVGADGEGRLLLQALEARGVSPAQLLVHPSRQTQAKHRIIAEGQMLLRFDQGSTQALDVETERALIARLIALWDQHEAIIISDYGYGILTLQVVATIAELQARSPRMLFGDSRHLQRYRQVGLTAVKPNYQETLQLLGGCPVERGQRAAWMVEQGERILNLTGARIAAVTMDTEGALIFERGSPPYRTYARPTANSRAAGAGDTFVSTMALALAAGAPYQAAAELASAAAAVVVSKDGTATCSGAELQEYLSAGERYIADRGRLALRCELYRQQGSRIVFTNGCFDLLHRGHVALLNRAKALGDILIVGVNSDAGVQRARGPGRPITNLEDRVQILAALSCIDHIIAFDEETPHDLIRAIRPDVFVKGSDYTREMLPEVALVEELGGVVELLPLVPEHSTSGIIERIREAGGREREVGTTVPAVA